MIKDTPEGQTHSYNDGCGDKEHNCDCKEKSCPENCPLRHTHKGVFCKLCRPDMYEVSSPEKKECNCSTKYCKHYESDFDRFVKESEGREWEKELDEKFGHIQIFKEWKSRDEKYGGIKVFIRKIIKDAIREEKERIAIEVDRVVELYKLNAFTIDAEILRHVKRLIILPKEHFTPKSEE